MSLGECHMSLGECHLSLVTVSQFLSYLLCRPESVLEVRPDSPLVPPTVSPRRSALAKTVSETDSAEEVVEVDQEVFEEDGEDKKDPGTPVKVNLAGNCYERYS